MGSFYCMGSYISYISWDLIFLIFHGILYFYISWDLSCIPFVFTLVAPCRSMLSRCRKIGEGAYGEVFVVDPDPQVEGDVHRVLKVMPIEGKDVVNGEPQKSFAESFSEIVISM